MGSKGDLGYPIDDPCLKALLENVALGTRASFTYNPSEDDIKRYIAKNILRKKVKQVKDNDVRNHRDQARR